MNIFNVVKKKGMRAGWPIIQREYVLFRSTFTRAIYLDAISQQGDIVMEVIFGHVLPDCEIARITEPTDKHRFDPRVVECFSAFEQSVCIRAAHAADGRIRAQVQA
jgi:hypothetical protein